MLVMTIIIHKIFIRHIIFYCCSLIILVLLLNKKIINVLLLLLLYVINIEYITIPLLLLFQTFFLFYFCNESTFKKATFIDLNQASPLYLMHILMLTNKWRQHEKMLLTADMTGRIYWPSLENPFESNSQCQADSCQFMSWQHLVESIRFQWWF